MEVAVRRSEILWLLVLLFSLALGQTAGEILDRVEKNLSELAGGGPGHPPRPLGAGGA